MIGGLFLGRVLEDGIGARCRSFIEVEEWRSIECLSLRKTALSDIFWKMLFTQSLFSTVYSSAKTSMTSSVLSPL